MANWFTNIFGDKPEPEQKFDRMSVLDDIRNEYKIESLNAETALKVSYVFACVRVIAEGLAQVPCKLYRTEEDGRRVEATDHRLYNLLHRAPNDWQSSFEFREQVGFHLALRGNAYIYVNRNARGQPLELYAYDPKCVKIEQDDDYNLSYVITVKGGKQIRVPASAIWHLRGPSWNGFEGLDIVDTAANAIGLGRAAEVFGQKFFENGARPGGVLVTDQNLTKEKHLELVEQWRSQYAGQANAHKTAVLGNGLKYNAIAATADEAQWTETRKHQINEICRFFRVQPVMIQANEGATSYNSIEQLFLSHLTHTLMPWFTRFEQSAYQNLLTPADKKAGYFIKLEEKALLRASTAERTAYYNAGRTQGWLTANEIRVKEDLPRSDDPKADELSPAANLFGSQDTSTDDEETQDDN
ncbi:phage portal protein [Qipengyuania citrea]|uniref:phage portal protein n=1 Tax=Qipengyuania citrea TaxID=225971 RepID=UPI001E5E079B|nr:phage portal protein [Qipengyuania citrea]MCD1591803.1 phage portal protein [Qipengyuania citrea]